MFWTTQTNNASENLYGGLEYRLNDRTTLFGTASAAWDQTMNNTRGPTWTSAAASTGYFFNQTTGADEVWSKRFAPEEIGGASAWNRRWNDTSGNVALGVRGTIGDSSWNYEAAYSASGYQSRATHAASSVGHRYLLSRPAARHRRRWRAIYAPNPNRFSTPLTPAQYAPFFSQSASQNDSWTQTFSLSANGDLFRLPAGMVKAAGVLEYGTQGFSNTPDSLINQGAYYNVSDAQNVSGNRKRYAAALEFNVPIFRQLKCDRRGPL